MSDVQRYQHIGSLVRSSPKMRELYPAATVYVLASDYDALRAELSAIKGGGEAATQEPALRVQLHKWGEEDWACEWRVVDDALRGPFNSALYFRNFKVGDTVALYTHPPVVAEAEAVEPAYQTCNGKSCGWCREGKEPCLFTDAQRKKRDQLIGAPPASGAVPVLAVGGIELAARWVEQRASDYDAAHGHTDPDTGTREYPGDGAEYYGELLDIADGIRALLAKGVVS